MDALSCRSLLTLAMDLAFVAGGLGLLAGLGHFVLPFLGRRRVAVMASGVGSIAVESNGGGRGEQALRGISRTMLVLCLLALVVNVGASWARYLEVRHFPAQTLYEVIPLGTASGFLSLLVLHLVLGLNKTRGLARGFSDLLLGACLLGFGFFLLYALGLDPTGRPLPPALQSPWFATHIVAYFIGYFTLFIATGATWLYFAFKFWRGVLDRSRPASRGQLLWIFVLALIPAPFGVQGLLLGPGVLLLAGVVARISLALPGRMSWFDTWEAGADRLTWRIFLIGFPFLTAGLIQGALWAQDAWATYWGWDSKEVSALISWAFYAVYLHLRYTRGWRGERGMWLLFLGGFSIYITFLLFGYLPASQRSLHRYTDSADVPAQALLETTPDMTG